MRGKSRVTECISLAVLWLSLFCFASAGMAEENQGGMLVVKIEKQGIALGTPAGKAETVINGEIVYRIIQTAKGLGLELHSFGLVGSGIGTKQGKSGNISVSLKPGSAKSTYNPQNQTSESEFLAEVHYPLIDRIKGFIAPKEGEKEQDIYRSHTETFAGKLTCILTEKLVLPEKITKMEKGTIITIKMDMKEKVLGEISQFAGTLKAYEVVVFPKFYLKKTITIQPVFIRYTPDTGCFGGTTTATTGGSFATLRDKAIEMWNRCCISLNFLTPVYIENNDYRILSSAEEAALLAAYDAPNAVEVFFVEVSDPVGLHGGGASYSSGTANAKIITYDTNLPINLYNLAHELGHTFGLMHPPGNSTPGSLMEPSGFCADNPALMSKKNCDNASNPLLTTHVPFTLCIRKPNM
jgi:hypothetical protein